MTATAAAPRPRAVGRATPSALVRFCALLVSEWTKFWSVRSTYWTLLIAIVTPIAIGDLVAFAFGQAKKGPPPDPLQPGFYALEYAVLAVCVLGVLQFSSEYSTGLIRTTFTAVPRRRAVLAAKAIVIGSITFVSGQVTAFATFFIAQAALNTKHRSVSWSHPGVPGAVVANGTVLFVCAMFALAIGAILRHTAGGISTTIALIILPTILGLLPHPWGPRIGRFTMIDAAQQVSVLRPQTDLLSPTFSMVVLLAWPAIALVVAAVMVTRTQT